MMVCGVPCGAAPAVQQQVDELVVYMRGDFTVPLEKREFPTESCFGCHPPNERTSYGQVIERTKEYTVDDEKINPHDPHAGLERSEYDLDYDFGPYQCRSCHQMHEESPGINACYACHHSKTLANCRTCHPVAIPTGD